MDTTLVLTHTKTVLRERLVKDIANSRVVLTHEQEASIIKDLRISPLAIVVK